MSEGQWTWTVSQLEDWERVLYQQAREFGLEPREVDFRILDWEQMADFMAYGMTFHYRHWSFGKDYDLTRSAKRYEAQGLPYEAVINTAPAVAVLWRENNLVLQILVMAHVFGHVDFYLNNLWFQKLTKAERVEDTCRAHAREIDDISRDPSIPSERVEELITAAHTLMFHRPRTLTCQRETREEQNQRLVKKFKDQHRPRDWDHLKPKAERLVAAPDLDKVPLEPDQDLLRFLAEYAPLQDWERRILHIVAAESDRLMPNIQTKIMNEGWATYWHDRLVKAVPNLPPGFEIEYARSMAGVTAPRSFDINPYWLGVAVWRDIYRRYETPDRNDPQERDLPGGQGHQKLFEIRQTNSDATFLGSYLSDRLITELGLVALLYEGDHLDHEHYRITDVPDRTGFERIRRKLIANVGLNDHPVIEVLDAHYYGDRTLELGQVHDGRDLKLFEPDASLRFLERIEQQRLSSIEHVMRHIQKIWHNPIRLYTKYDGVNMVVTCDIHGAVDVKKAP